MDDDAPAFLTTREVAALLRVRERKIYDMAAAGALPCRRVTGKLLFPRDQITAWLQGAPAAVDAAPEPAPAPAAPPIVAGSHDPLLDWAIRESGAGLATAFDGSMDGLAQLAQGRACAAGLHVYDPAADDWNRPALRARLAGAPVAAVAWAARTQGLILGPAAACAGGVADLVGLRVVRRQPAAGAAILLEHLLAQAGVADAVHLTDAVARTETDAADAVARGDADAAPGLESVARQFGLGFLPLVRERFDLAVDRRAYFEPPIQTLLAFARGPACAARAAALGGYDLSDLGAVRWNAR